jgi:hypothetical protein
MTRRIGGEIRQIVTSLQCKVLKHYPLGLSPVRTPSKLPNLFYSMATKFRILLYSAGGDGMYTTCF